jgi:hypothetical protein
MQLLGGFKMTTKELLIKGGTAKHSPLVFDDIENLFIGHFRNVDAHIQTISGENPVRLWGEILLYGRLDADGKSFIVGELRRVAAGGGLIEPKLDKRFSSISLAGPLEVPQVGPSVSGGEIVDIRMQLHYSALSQLKPLLESEHAVYSQVDTILTNLSWKQISEPVENSIVLEINFASTKRLTSPIDPPIFESIRFDQPIRVSFDRAGSGKPLAETILPLNAPPPAAPPPGPCSPSLTTIVRTLDLNFVNLTHHAVDAAVTTLMDRVNEVWRDKAALTVTHTITPGLANDIETFFSMDQIEEGTVATAGYDHPAIPTMEVYLIESFATNNQHGGGFAPLTPANAASAFCIVEVGAAATNPYLLAHELGHALGLQHPDGTQGTILSSLNSVMQPSGPGASNNPSNTLFNMRSLLCCTPPLNPLIQTTAAPGCFHPDNDFYIRDFPNDHGTEPSVVPANQNYWDHSNVWNRRANQPGNPTPAHEDPRSSDTQNFMFVELTYNPAQMPDPVDVKLYITEPWTATPATVLTPLSFPNNNNNVIHFDPPPLQPAPPLVLSLQWDPSAVAALFPEHACVFAIAGTRMDCTPCIPPGPVTYGQVASLILDSNKLAQRNLNFQHVAPPPAPFWMWLPWIKLANPFDFPVTTRIAIDTNLERLYLEFDEGTPIEIRPGVEEPYNLPGRLAPGEERILRLKTVLPVNAEIGATFPISLEFFANERSISGYTHVIEVRSLSVVVEDTLNSLYGALMAVSVGCRNKTAVVTARNVKTFLNNRMDEYPPEPVLRLFRRLASDLLKISALIDPLSVGRLGQVHDHLIQLAGLLSLGRSSFTPQTIERIRTQIDRIYEPASDLARQVTFRKDKA